ncbi:DNA primase [Bacillus alkalicellulosilyticus]|uniref:DNA primase n=1 Tax=Alkalihalobacterium alkalicellulosilyticum TaxID=1912214 RepID=UPI0009978E81|nr:DNA primase [Bacillus alkalicellulosilyticus]
MGTRIHDDKLELIRKSSDIVEVISDYVQLKKQGRNYVGLCPFHGEKTPSFSVSSEKQLYHCFGCGVGGNVFSFVKEIEGYTFIEAVKKLSERANIPLPELDDVTASKTDEQQEMARGHDLAAKFYNHILLNVNSGKVGLDYLYKRGFTKDMIDTFQLGFAPDSWDSLLNFLDKRKCDPKIMEQGGLLSIRDFDQKYYDRFRNRVMFPIWDSQGQVIAFGGRTLGDGKPKYLNSSETKIFSKSKTLYGLHLARPHIRKENLAVLFEGYVDVIAAWGAGVPNGVATLGTSLTEQQAKIIRRNAENVVVCYDSDEAGVQAAFRAASIMEALGAYVRVATLPESLDPDDFIQKYGAERFKTDVIGASLTLMAFKMQYLRRGKNLQDEGERMRYIEEVLKEIALLPRPVERDHYLRQIAEEFSLSLDALKQEQHQAFRAQKSSNNPKTEQQKQTEPKRKSFEKKKLLPAFHKAEQILLAHMMKDADISDTVQQRIGGQFNVDEYQAIAAYLYAFYAEGHYPDPAQFIQQIKDERLVTLATEIAMMDISDEISGKELDDYLRKIENYPKWVEIEQKEIEKKEAEKRKDVLLAAQIGMEIIKMTQELKR